MTEVTGEDRNPNTEEVELFILSGGNMAPEKLEQTLLFFAFSL